MKNENKLYNNELDKVSGGAVYISRYGVSKREVESFSYDENSGELTIQCYTSTTDKILGKTGYSLTCIADSPEKKLKYLKLLQEHTSDYEHVFLDPNDWDLNK